MTQTKKRRRGRPSRVPATVLAVRRFIAGEDLQMHDQLPSEPDLAERLGVSCMTLRKALGELAAEGVVERRHGVGTFVTHRPLRRIGYAFKERTFYRSTSEAFRCMYRETQEWARARRMDACFLPRDEDGRLTSTAIEMLGARSVDGVMIVTGQNAADVEARLATFGIPAVQAFCRPGDHITGYAVAQQSRLGTAVEALAAVDQDRAGLIGQHFATRDVDREMVICSLAEHGLRTSPDWLFPGRVPREDAIENGRLAARQWLETADRPGALVAIDPYEVQGFLYELLGPGNRPETMPVIAMTEAEESLLDLPWPVIRIQYCARPTIDAALEMLVCLMRGEEPPEPVIVIEPEVRTIVPDNLRCACAAS